MRKIEVTIPPFTLEHVREELVAAGADGLTVTEVKVLDPQARTACYRGATFDITFKAQCKLEVVVPDDRVARVIDALRAHVVGPTDIVLHAVDDSVRIRTGEHVRGARAA